MTMLLLLSGGPNIDYKELKSVLDKHPKALTICVKACISWSYC